MITMFHIKQKGFLFYNIMFIKIRFICQISKFMRYYQFIVSVSTSLFRPSRSKPTGRTMFWFVKRVNPTKIPMSYIHEWHYGKAGRLVGKADCCAVASIADNATFLLAANRMAAFRSQSQIRQHCPFDNICCCGSTGRPSATEAWSCGITWDISLPKTFIPVATTLHYYQQISIQSRML